MASLIPLPCCSSMDGLLIKVSANFSISETLPFTCLNSCIPSAGHTRSLPEAILLLYEQVVNGRIGAIFVQQHAQQRSYVYSLLWSCLILLKFAMKKRLKASKVENQRKRLITCFRTGNSYALQGKHPMNDMLCDPCSTKGSQCY
ncbi:uncharacterized protein LOC125218911 isoform X1 [Salvia hispanica]|uniref:uncharacterized protein LOC125218911 isoform X1 n=1 Tax=Salvia hispanica TaxID=49212 RepID=UPI0020098A42|nr:uncharacterized protein LOC125218911 isoform X1 [Salvia hispanica]